MNYPHAIQSDYPESLIIRVNFYNCTVLLLHFMDRHWTSLWNKELAFVHVKIQKTDYVNLWRCMSNLMLTNSIHFFTLSTSPKVFYTFFHLPCCWILILIRVAPNVCFGPPAVATHGYFSNKLAQLEEHEDRSVNDRKVSSTSEYLQSPTTTEHCLQ